MVSAVKWEQKTASGTSTTLEGNGAALLNDNIVEANDAVYAGSTALDTIGYLTFTGTFGTAPSDASPSLDIYVAQKTDDVNFDDAPLTGGADQGHLYKTSIPVQKINTAQRLTVGPIALSGHDAKFFVDNQTGQTLNAAWTLTLRNNNLEGQ